LAGCRENVDDINEKLEPLDSIVNCILEQPSFVALFENGDFNFWKVVVKQETVYALGATCKHDMKGKHLHRKYETMTGTVNHHSKDGAHSIHIEIVTDSIKVWIFKSFGCFCLSPRHRSTKVFQNSLTVAYQKETHDFADGFDHVQFEDRLSSNPVIDDARIGYLC